MMISVPRSYTLYVRLDSCCASRLAEYGSVLQAVIMHFSMLIWQWDESATAGVHVQAAAAVHPGAGADVGHNSGPLGHRSNCDVLLSRPQHSAGEDSSTGVPCTLH